MRAAAASGLALRARPVRSLGSSKALPNYACLIKAVCMHALRNTVLEGGLRVTRHLLVTYWPDGVGLWDNHAGRFPDRGCAFESVCTLSYPYSATYLPISRPYWYLGFFCQAITSYTQLYPAIAGYTGYSWIRLQQFGGRGDPL